MRKTKIEVTYLYLILHRLQVNLGQPVGTVIESQMVLSNPFHCLQRLGSLNIHSVNENPYNYIQAKDEQSLQV